MSENTLGELDVDVQTVKRAQWEGFEFSVEAGSVVVRNGSYPDDELDEHTYSVTIEDGVPARCDCPSDEYHDGACKHRAAVAIRRPVLEAASVGRTPASSSEDTAPSGRSAPSAPSAPSARSSVATDGGTTTGSVRSVDSAGSVDSVDSVGSSSSGTGSVGSVDRETSDDVDDSARLFLFDLAREHVAAGEGELLALDFDPFCVTVEATADALETAVRGARSD